MLTAPITPPASWTALLGPAAAIGSAMTWAFASVIYTQAAKSLGAATANLLRALIVLPIYALLAVVFYGPAALVTVPLGAVGWLTLSTLCSFALGDLVFYMAALRLGTPTALAIAAVYPVWATLAGVLWLGETLTRTRSLGLVCCVTGVVWLIVSQRRLGAAAPPAEEPARENGHSDRDDLDPAAAHQAALRAGSRRYAVGLSLALLTSLMWAGNSYSLRQAGSHTPFLVVNTLRFTLATAVLYVAFRLRRDGTLRACLQKLASPRRFYITVLFEALGGSSLFVFALSSTDLSVAAPLCSLAPLFAVPVGVFMRTDRLSGHRILAICITMAGVIALLR